MKATDEKEFAIAVKVHGNFKISNLQYPKIVENGDTFILSYNVTNFGEQDTAYGYLKDENNIEIANTRWECIIGKNKTVTKTNTLVINTSLNATLHIGFVK
jgi:hypothetical protein